MLKLEETEWVWEDPSGIVNHWRKSGKNKVDYWFRLLDGSRQFPGAFPISHIHKDAQPVVWRCKNTKATVGKESICEYVYRFRKKHGVANSYSEAVSKLNELVAAEES